MSERGVFAVDRGIFDHPMFAPEPFTEREAWAWLISEASFKPRVRRIGSVVVPLERGQLAVSLRFLAERWDWPKSKVERFLDRLKRGASSRGGRPKKNLEKAPSQSGTMIETQSETGITIITICNYAKYQRVSMPTETVSETANETRTRHQRDKLENNKNTKLDDDDGKRAKLISDEAQETADALASICGYPDQKNCPVGWYGAAMWVQKCLNEGWSAPLMIEAARDTAKRKRDGPIESFKYLEKPLAKAIAEHSRPLPKVEIRETETVVSYGTAKPKSGGSILAAIDREIAKLGEENADLAAPAYPVLRISR